MALSPKKEDIEMLWKWKPESILTEEYRLYAINEEQRNEMKKTILQISIQTIEMLRTNNQKIKKIDSDYLKSIDFLWESKRVEEIKKAFPQKTTYDNKKIGWNYKK